MNMLMSMLSNNGYIVVNKSVINKLGLHEAVILGELCSEFSYWNSQNKLDNNYFYTTRENIQRNTGLSPYQQRDAIKKLSDIGILETKSMGMPLKVYYKINEDKVFEILFEMGLKLSSEETSHQEVKKLDDKISNNLSTCNEKNLQHDVKKLDININNNKNNNNNLLSSHKDFFKEKDYREILKSNIEYDIISEDEDKRGMLDNIVNIVIEILISKREYTYINSDLKSTEIVKNQFMKLKAHHIEFVINSLQKNVNDIKNINSYMLTALYNSINTIDIDTKLQVSKILNNG